jgi:hypothetical protein
MRGLRRATSLRHKLANLGHLADYQSWCEQEFGHVVPLRRREQLWELMAERLATGPVRGLEFGVAHGYASAWWLTRLPSADLRWEGFDRFTGLPRTWRDLEAGHFDTGGLPPAINDPRVIWHVGDISDTIEELDYERSSGERWLLFFDLDLFEPSVVAWEALQAHVRPGDVLYFDEAYDRDERHLIQHHVLPQVRCGLVGCTPVALALHVL